MNTVLNIIRIAAAVVIAVLLIAVTIELFSDLTTLNRAF